MTQAANLAVAGGHTQSPGYFITTGTVVASTSGTSVEFTSIPSWAKRITMMFSSVSTNVSADFLVQLGSGSFTTSGYLGASTRVVSTTSSTGNSTAGFYFNYGQGAGASMHGNITLTLLTGTTWSGTGLLADSSTAATTSSAGSVTLSGACDRIRFTTVVGTPTFDAGSINILYEG